MNRLDGVVYRSGTNLSLDAVEVYSLPEIRPELVRSTFVRFSRMTGPGRVGFFAEIPAERWWRHIPDAEFVVLAAALGAGEIVNFGGAVMGPAMRLNDENRAAFAVWVDALIEAGDVALGEFGAGVVPAMPDLPLFDPYSPEYAERHRGQGDEGDWFPASGGTETPFVTRNGKRLLYVYQPSTGRHAYLDLDSDVILSDEDARAALRLGGYGVAGRSPV